MFIKCSGYFRFLFSPAILVGLPPTISVGRRTAEREGNKKKLTGLAVHCCQMEGDWTLASSVLKCLRPIGSLVPCV